MLRHVKEAEKYESSNRDKKWPQTVFQTSLSLFLSFSLHKNVTLFQDKELLSKNPRVDDLATHLLLLYYEKYGNMKNFASVFKRLTSSNFNGEK